MRRTARNGPGGIVYRVLNRANGWLRLFKKEEDFQAFEFRTRRANMNGAMMKFRTAIAFFVILMGFAPASAEVSLPRVIGNHMVLQRGRSVSIWGTAAPAESVTVSFGGMQKEAKADEKGAWSVWLDPLEASAEPREMRVQGTNTLTLSDILVGEVWLCSGQSNMEYAMGSNNAPTNTTTQPWSVKRDAMKRPASMATDLAAANDPQMRLFKVPKSATKKEQSRGWEACDPHTLSDFSAAGYYFGRKIRAELKVPIGLIESSYGGTRIEPWTPPSAYSTIPAFAAEVGKAPLKIDDVAPGKLYAAMIRPLVPYTLRGFLWYQGETNIMMPSGGARYTDKMQALIDSWREAFGSPDLSFYYVQIAPLYYSKRKDANDHPPDAYSVLREAQTRAMQIPHTGMIVTTDLVTDLNDIHPPRKVEVGERLARWALANDYGRTDVVCHSPEFKEMTIHDGRAVLTFAHADGGLVSKDGKPLTCFTIAGSDGHFVPAQAECHDDTVKVSSADVPQPAFVRFAWGEADMPNLFSAAGLPAIPFRTDSPRESGK